MAGEGHVHGCLHRLSQAAKRRHLMQPLSQHWALISAPLVFFDSTAPPLAGTRLPSREYSLQSSCCSLSFNSLKKAPDFQPDLSLFPIPQPPPLGRRGKEIHRANHTGEPHCAKSTKCPPGTCSNRRGAARCMGAAISGTRAGSLPLGVGQQLTVSRHQLSFGPAAFAYIPSREG